MFAVVVAHPDDEAFSWAGTVALHADDARFRFVLVHATRGEAGDIRPGFSATRDTLGAIRQAESEAAWRAVGRPPDRHEWLGYPAGGLSEIPADELRPHRRDPGRGEAGRGRGLRPGRHHRTPRPHHSRRLH